MILVSDMAKATLWIALQNSDVAPPQALRVQPGVAGLDLTVGCPAASDRVIYHNGSPVLVIDRALDDEIKDLVLDMAGATRGLEVVVRPYPGVPGDTCLWFGQDSW
ncbi:MAG: hypothetical protein ACE5Q6_21550 [Dehalococcoidia bacterium]